MKRPQSLLWIILAIIAGGLILLIVNTDSGQVFGIENEKFARTLNLAVWGVVIAAALVFSRYSLGHIAKNLGIWLVIILVLIAGYQYRYELQDIASRITAGLVPGSPMSLVSKSGDDLVMLEKSPGGHFEARAHINGKPVLALIDTGATRTVLSAGDAARLGYDADRLAYVVPVMTANGTARAARVTAREISVGSIMRRNLPVLVAPPGKLDRSLLGMDFIGTLSGFDLRGDRLILRD